MVITATIILCVVAAFIIYHLSVQTFKFKLLSLNQFLAEGNSGKHSLKAYGSFTERILLWQHTLKMVKEYPVFGCGLSNWKTLLPEYGIFNIGFIDLGTLKFEHPHNDYLLTLAETGFIGLLAYLLIFLFALKQAFTNFKNHCLTNSKEALVQIILFSGITGFMVLSMFAFPKERFYPVLLLMIMFAYIKSTSLNNNIENSKYSLAFFRIFLISGIFISCFSFYFLSKRYLGEIHFSRALVCQTQKNWQGMKEEATAANSFYYQSDRLAVPLSWYAGFASFYSNNIFDAQYFFAQSVKLNPWFVQGWNDLGTCYEQYKNFPEAITCYKKAISINPEFSSSRLNLVAAYYNTGKLDTAYRLISEYPKEKSTTQYVSYLLTILRAKINIDFNASDEPVKAKVEAKIKNDKYLYNLYFKSKQLNVDIDSLLYKEIKK